MTGHLLKIIELIFLHIHTIKYLKFSQVFYRFLYIVNRPSLSLRVDNAKYFSPVAPIGTPKANSSVDASGKVYFFGGCLGKNQIKWGAENKDKLWQYNLHYFDFLNGKNLEQTICVESWLVSDWIKANPPCKTIGWDPYPTSLRIINWIKWSHNVQRLPAGFVENLFLQTRWLRKRLEYHLLANHLFVNAKALVFSGVSFAGDEAEEWLIKGISILRHEIDEQILSDGGHFERSPMYHSIILEDVLDLISVLKTPSRKLPPIVINFSVFLEQKVVLMVSWLREMCHPDGQISFFNDTTFAVAPTLMELETYAASLDLKLQPPDYRKAFNCKHLQDSGFISVCYDRNTRLIADVGSITPDYQPGHSHAESLSFELSIEGERFFVNSGISTYESSDLRLFQRATKSHNTVEVDGKNSSEIWSSFRVAKRAVVSNVSLRSEGGTITFCGTHDGYSNRTSKVMHYREWIMRQGLISIADRIDGEFKSAVFFLHIHPNVVAKQIDDKAVCLTGQYGTKLCATFHGGLLKLTKGKWNSSFCQSSTNQCIQVEFYTHKLTTEITWAIQ